MIQWIQRQRKLQLASVRQRRPWEPQDRTAAKPAVGTTGPSDPIADLRMGSLLPSPGSGSLQDESLEDGPSDRLLQNQRPRDSYGHRVPRTGPERKSLEHTESLLPHPSSAARGCSLTAFAAEVAVYLDNEEAAILL